MSAIDLTGRQFGRLLVLGPAPAANGKRRWFCRCECGGAATPTTGGLRSGNTRSCGCMSRDSTAARNAARRGQAAWNRADLVGQRFARLVVLAPAAPTTRGVLRWRCRCDCGGEAVPTTGALRSGNTGSCGCLQVENARKAARLQGLGQPAANRLDLAGLRFGRLEVTGFERTHVTPGGTARAMWRAMCDCGRETVATAINLRSGEVASCGCNMSRPSGPEQELVAFIRGVAPDLIADRQLAGTRFRFDAIIPGAHLVVELNGVFWHSAAKVARDYHLRKRLASEAAGYRQISIWQDEWLARPDRFKALIARALGVAPVRRVAARQTTVREIDAQAANEWHQAHHVQRGRVVGRHLALEDGGDVIAVGTFLKHTLARYSVREGCMVMGGLPKLIAASGLDRVVTYCDRDHFTGSVYAAAGFVRTGTTLQLTYLVGSERVRRETLMKHKLPGMGIAVPDGATEREALEAASIFQCWNSGVDRWEWRR